MTGMATIRARWGLCWVILVFSLAAGLEPARRRPRRVCRLSSNAWIGPRNISICSVLMPTPRDNDFLTVIDVNPDSASYGTILHTVDLGTKGNETHHWGYTDDRMQDLGWRAVLEPDLDSRCRDRPGQAANREGPGEHPRSFRSLGPSQLLCASRPDADRFPGFGRRRLAGGTGGVYQRWQVHPAAGKPERGPLWL